jgi:hypothetical protein
LTIGGVKQVNSQKLLGLVAINLDLAA